MTEKIIIMKKLMKVLQKVASNFIIEMGRKQIS